MIKKCSLQYANDYGFWGPAYHGTVAENRTKIEKEGFKIIHGSERSGEVRNGYINQPYHDDIPAPVHHLGYGVYFTTNLTIAKQYSGGTLRNMPTYYINSKRIGEINFGATGTMMKWWIKNGYDPKLAKVDRVAATQLLTNNLKKHVDAIWYKGKGLKRLLDGDQVCVYYPDLIYQIDKSLTTSGEIGSKVIRKSDGMKGILLTKREIPEHVRKQYHHGEKYFLTVRWQKGTDHNVYSSQVKFV
jgi:hypothetical protein